MLPQARFQSFDLTNSNLPVHINSPKGGPCIADHPYLPAAFPHSQSQTPWPQPPKYCRLLFSYMTFLHKIMACPAIVQIAAQDKTKQTQKLLHHVRAIERRSAALGAGLSEEGNCCSTAKSKKWGRSSSGNGPSHRIPSKPLQTLLRKAGHI